VRSGGVWTQQQELAASDGVAGDNFGYSVSLSGDTTVIGACGKNGNQGAVYVFVSGSDGWSQQKLTDPGGAVGGHFGISVSAGGKSVVIGAYGKNDNQRAAYVFVRSGGVWIQQRQLTASDGVANDVFGNCVSASSDIAAIGAERDNSGQGAAYAFVRPSLGTGTLLVGSAAGSSSVVLSYSGAWTATANDSFLHISASSASGTGSALVVFTYDAFTGTGTRTGTLSIAGLAVTVTQAGTNYFETSPLTTLVSSGLNDPLGVAVDSSGNVYIADSRDNAIKKWCASTQQAIVLVSTGLSSPDGVAVDNSGNVYISDTGNNAIKEWTASTQQVTTLVSSGLNHPVGVAVDSSGNVYIADYLNNAIKEWNALTQQMTTLVSSGLTGPYGVAVEGSGNVYIADALDSAIKEWNASTQQVTSLVSSGLNHPRGPAVEGSGNIYFADGFNGATKEIPYAFVGPASLTEHASAGTDSLLPVLPSTTSLTGIFGPTSDQSWLTIGTIANGVVSFAFTANSSSSARTAHITILGRQITVMQNGLEPQSISFGPLPDQVLGIAPFTISASATSGLTVSFASTTPLVCTVSDATTNVSYAVETPLFWTQASQASQWSTLSADVVIPMNTSTPGTTLTTAIANAGTVSNTCVPGSTCSFDSVPDGWTVGANQGVFSNPGPVQLDNGGTLYPAQSLNYNNLAHLDSANSTINDFVFSNAAGNYFSILAGFTLGMPLQSNGDDYDLIMVQDGSGLYDDVQVSEGCGGSDGAFGVRIENHAVQHSPCISLSAAPSSYYMATTWDTVDGMACLWVWTPQGTPVGTSCETDTGGSIGNVRIFSNENGTDSGTTYYQNVMMKWTGTPPGGTATFINGSATVTGSGFPTDNSWNNALLNIGGTAYTIASVQSATQLTLAASFSGATVTLAAVGTCIIQATQAGDSNYAAAPSVSQSFQVTASPCDTTQDGNTNVADLQRLINEALGIIMAADDLNGDGVVNIVDVQIAINAALGLGCTES
jgi:sugar lactone lactonase YvrE